MVIFLFLDCDWFSTCSDQSARYGIFKIFLWLTPFFHPIICHSERNIDNIDRKTNFEFEYKSVLFMAMLVFNYSEVVFKTVSKFRSIKHKLRQKQLFLFFWFFFFQFFHSVNFYCIHACFGTTTTRNDELSTTVYYSYCPFFLFELMNQHSSIKKRLLKWNNFWEKKWLWILSKDQNKKKA